TLLSSIIKGSAADICVLALIGERGREVREFIEHDLGPEGRQKAVLVVSTSDRSSMERLKAAYTATAIAEYFRDQGGRVLLLMDSVTRFGRAQREIGLAAGEPPTRRGFPPSVFSTLPRLMERAGNSDKGSITALYTVLVEGDDMTEPIADETRSILDGHIVLSRKLASANHYPAIDVMASVSRVMGAITDKKHREAAQKLRAILAKYAEIELLVQIGEYQKGNDAEADQALEKIGAVNAFLRQGLDERSPFADTLAALLKTVA
ncbi:MAG: FliI/YscN family ATPase, partial [Zoogloeaceae bacterium]|nr:FliI/YscN family ATPase [Zoogloeaceae bacterium]